MASVRIEGEALADGRYDRLARVAGLADADHARGKMVRLWHQCTIEKRYVLPETDVETVLGVSGVDALVEANLGERVSGGVRIRGTKGRIEWLEKLRKNGSKGGRPKGSKTKTKRKPSGFLESNPPAPAPAPSGIPDLSPATPLPLPTSPPRSFAATQVTGPTGIARRVWKAYLEAFNATRPPGVPEMGDRIGAAGEKAISELLPGLMAEFANDTTKVEATLMHALAVARAEASRSTSTQWLDEDMWQPHRFRRLRVRQVGGEPEKKPHTAQRHGDGYHPPARLLGPKP